MEVTYNEDLSKAFFNGYAFRRDVKTGYYLCSKKTDIGRRERLHCYVWRFFNGDIPSGYHVHHKDGDKSHNDIENLDCIPEFAHLSHHGKERAITDREKMVENLKENALPKAVEWHKSAAGHEWHKQHCDGLKRKIECVCEVCGKRFMTRNNGRIRFCGNKCKAAARRKSGVDDEKRKCVVCGNVFTTNKYSKTQTCSAKCRNAICWDKRHKAH